MKVAKWGNSLAIRIPKELAEALKLVEGTEVTLKGKPGTELEMAVDDSAARRRAAAIARIREMRAPTPRDFKFSRDEVYDSLRRGKRGK